MTNPTPIGLTLRRLRKSRNYTQGELASKAGISREGVSRHERAETIPSLPQLLRYAKALGIHSSVLTDAATASVPTAKSRRVTASITRKSASKFSSHGHGTRLSATRQRASR